MNTSQKSWLVGILGIVATIFVVEIRKFLNLPAENITDTTIVEEILPAAKPVSSSVQGQEAKNRSTGSGRPMVFLSFPGSGRGGASDYLRRHLERRLQNMNIDISANNGNNVDLMVLIDIQDQVEYIDTYGANTYAARCEVGVSITEKSTNRRLYSDTISSERPVPGFTAARAQADCIRKISDATSEIVVAGLSRHLN